MIHAGMFAGDTTGGGGGGNMVDINFNPPGGVYAGNNISVLITVSGGTVAKFRWRTSLVSTWTTVNALSGTVTFALNHTLYCDALDSSGMVLNSDSDFYERSG